MVMLSWHDLDGGSLCVAYSSDGKSIFPDLTDYSSYLSLESGLNKLTVSNELRHLAGFVAHVRAKRRLVSSVDDSFIGAWRDLELKRVAENRISRGRERTSKRTVNAKLRRVYQFLWWYQERKLRIPNLIGPVGCRVTSSEPTGGQHVRYKDGRRTWRQSSKALFPLCFPNAGNGSKHRVTRVPTSATLDKVRLALRRENLGFVEQRNLLMLAIAEETGLRRAAINSLRAGQFTEELLNDIDDNKLIVTPDVQKFSYDFPTEFPLRLCLLILNFVEQTLKPLYRARHWPLSIGKDRLFISERSGRPLADSALTRIFSSAFREAGFEKGSAVHLIRHYFTNIEIVRETKRRMDAGLDTSVASICASVSLKLNHKDPLSIQPYVSAVISEMARELESGALNKPVR
jgi:integrase